METQKYCKIYIVRHGETEFNVKKIIQGQIDSPLTEKGKQQALERAEDLKNIRFDAIFSSDLGRAHRTAEIIALDRALAVNTTKLLREKFFGTYEGRVAQEFIDENKKLFEMRDKLSDSEKMEFKYEPTQESDADTAVRMMAFFREIAATYAGKTVLAVSHGSIMRSFLKHLGYVKYDELPGGSIDNTGYIIIESDGVDFFVKETKGVNKREVDS